MAGPARPRVLCTALALILATALGATAAPECMLDLGGTQQSFDVCYAVEGIGNGFTLLWTLLPGNTALKMAMNSSSRGYVAFGFPPDPEPDTGAMIGGTALSLQSCSSCPSGAQLAQWFLGGTSSGEMQPSNYLQVSNITAAALPGGGMAASFILQLPEGQDTADTDFILAAGAVYSNGAMRKHEQYGEINIDLSTGTLGEDPETHSIAVSALVAAHLWLLIIGWGVFIPCGIVIARCLKRLDPLWFQSLGFVMGVIGLALGFSIAGGWNGLFPVHRNLGLAATILGLFQVIAVIPRLRPKLVSRHRRAWNLYHWWQGRAAVLLAVANIYYGLINIQNLGAGVWGAYTAVFAAIVTSAIAIDGYGYVQLPPPGLAKKVQGSGFALNKAGQDNGFGNLPGGITSDDAATTGTVTPATGYGSTVQLVPQP
ncbi:hypothetical protein ABPG75_007447 [Micractinium tetrahymenae]